jgi:hypothetical protein
MLYPGTFEAKNLGCICREGQLLGSYEYAIKDGCPVHGLSAWKIPSIQNAGDYRHLISSATALKIIRDRDGC